MASERKTTEIAYDELLAAIQSDKKPLVIDVRKPEEIAETGRLPGSHNLPHSEIPAAFALPAEDFLSKYGFPRPKPDDSLENVVITCRSGRRVGLANEELAKLGYKGMRLYMGSYNEWKAKGGPLEEAK